GHRRVVRHRPGRAEAPGAAALRCPGHARRAARPAARPAGRALAAAGATPAYRTGRCQPLHDPARRPGRRDARPTDHRPDDLARPLTPRRGLFARPADRRWLTTAVPERTLWGSGRVSAGSVFSGAEHDTRIGLGVGELIAARGDVEVVVGADAAER